MLGPQQRVVSASALPGCRSLSFPGCLSFPACHSQQCQEAGEGSTSSSTKSNLFNVFKVPFSFRPILKTASGSSPHPSVFLQDGLYNLELTAHQRVLDSSSSRAWLHRFWLF